MNRELNPNSIPNKVFMKPKHIGHHVACSALLSPWSVFVLFLFRNATFRHLSSWAAGTTTEPQTYARVLSRPRLRDTHDRKGNCKQLRLVNFDKVPIYRVQWVLYVTKDSRGPTGIAPSAAGIERNMPACEWGPYHCSTCECTIQSAITTVCMLRWREGYFFKHVSPGGTTTITKKRPLSRCNISQRWCPQISRSLSTERGQIRRVHYRKKQRNESGMFALPFTQRRCGTISKISVGIPVLMKELLILSYNACPLAVKRTVLGSGSEGRRMKLQTPCSNRRP